MPKLCEYRNVFINNLEDTELNCIMELRIEMHFRQRDHQSKTRWDCALTMITLVPVLFSALLKILSLVHTIQA